jgi:hypothetical protein
LQLDHEWKIAKPGAVCSLCQEQLARAVDNDTDTIVAQSYFSALFESAAAMERRDYCADCFREKRPADVYYFWKTAITAGDANAGVRKPPPVDVEYVLEFFKRLEGDGAQQRIAFRYILALMLTRKKLLVADGKTRDAAGVELQVFREKRGGQAHKVYAPELQAEEIAAVTDELGSLLGLKPARPAKPQPELPFGGADAGAVPGGMAETAEAVVVVSTEADVIEVKAE